MSWGLVSYVGQPFLLWDYKRIPSWFLLVCHFSLPPFLFLSPSLLFSLPPSLLSFLHFFLFHLHFWPREGKAEARTLFAAIGFLPEPLPVPAAVPNLIYPRIQFQGNNILAPSGPNWRCFTHLLSFGKHFFSSQDFSTVGQWSFCPFPGLAQRADNHYLGLPTSCASTQHLKYLLPPTGAERTTAAISCDLELAS